MSRPGPCLTFLAAVLAVGCSGSADSRPFALDEIQLDGTAVHDDGVRLFFVPDSDPEAVCTGANVRLQTPRPPRNVGQETA